MNNIVQVFGDCEIRFVEHPERKYDFGIVATDLAKVIEHSTVSKMVESIDKEWKGASIVPTLGGNQSMTVIWEPGVYQLLAKSRKPQAKPFQKWLFEEVLPSIRKTGSYSVQQAPALPTRDAVDYIESAAKLEEMPDSTLKMLLRDTLIDELSLQRNNQRQLAGTPKQYTIVKVRAKQLGYSAREIGDGAALGRFIKRRIAPAYQEMIGRYPVFHYEITDALDTAIHSFFGATSDQMLMEI